MSSDSSHKIKKRDSPNDVFITPLNLAKINIDMIETNESDVWFDPFKNNGSYYNQYPTDNKDWCEILEGKDFFSYGGDVDVICSNPPYSLMDKILYKSCELNPRVIAYLIGVGNLTTRRIEMMENHGYKIVKLHMCKVWKWYGMSFFVVWEKTESDGIISYDRTVWREDKKTIHV